MNLDQIATKCFILALFIRDDGQRLLLGDGYYDFNQKLQHFQSNTIANDVVEIQGDSGQLLAGQVMRSGAQKFEGYIGDATTNRQTIEQKRSDFMAFFRIKHFYKVIYIFPDGTAIQRQRGYLTDAPTIPEIFQKFPEYSVALNFEDANYYEYAEDDHGDEIYAHIAELALAGEAIGGLIWDEIGAVTNGITWNGIQTAQGEYIQITNELSLEAPLASVEMLGNAGQNGTPTPTSPQPISVVTGENVVKIEGKNLFDKNDATNNTGLVWSSGNTFAENKSVSSGFILVVPTQTYTISHFAGIFFYDANKVYLGALQSDNTTIAKSQGNSVKTFTTPNINEIAYARLSLRSGLNGGVDMIAQDIMFELGSTATAYEPYQGQEFEVNLGKNLFNSWAENSGKITVADDGTMVISDVGGANGYCDTGKKLSDFAPTLKVGDVVLVYLESDFTTRRSFYCTENWSNGQTKTITQAMLDGSVVVYGGYQTTSHVKIMLTKGSTATTYAPYFTPIELAKIGNYQDRIYKEDSKWYIEKQVGKVVLDGSENWQFASMFYCTSPLQNIAECIVPSGGNIKSDYFTFSTGAINDPSIDIVGRYIIRIKDTSKATVSDLTTWLSTHNTTVYYALATPTTTEITNEALIAQLDALGASSLYLGANNIGTETQNAMPTLKIEYYTEYTLDGAGYEWEPGGNTAKTIVTVAGVDSAWPIWTIQGGAQNPTLTNITTGQTISWQGFVPEGQTLTINMAEMTADLAGANVFEYITGEWLRLAPGNNTLVYNAGNADKPSTLSWNGVLA